MWSSSNRPYSPYLTQVNESALSAIGCWDAGCPQASKMLEYQKQQTAAAVPRQRQLYKSGGQLEVSWPNWTQKIKGTRPVNFHGLKASSYVKLHKGGLSFLIFSDIVFIGNQSKLETHMSFKDCGTSLWNHFGQLSNITKLPGAFFLGVCAVASLPGCDEMHLKSFKNSDTFRILLASNLETLWLNKCRNLGI